MNVILTYVLGTVHFLFLFTCPLPKELAHRGGQNKKEGLTNENILKINYKVIKPYW